MNICIIGYGKMGKEIEKTAIARGHQVNLIIDIQNREDLISKELSSSDVAIDFTRPEVAMDNIRACFQAGIPIVTGTTGWYENLPDILEECSQMNQTLFYASNFSIGMNLFFNVNKYMAEIMNSVSDYEVSISETHHTQKLDAPSGTAITIADIIIKSLDRKNNWKLTDTTSPNTIAIEAKREGDVKGFHEVKYESEIDTIKFSHLAKSRKGFAIGAVMAAEFIRDKKGVFTMNDLLGI